MNTPTLAARQDSSNTLYASDNRRAVLVLAGLLITTFWLYFPSIGLPLFSESYTSQRLSSVTPPWGFFFTSAFLQEGYGVYYRPLTRAADGLLIRMTGGEPNGFVGHAWSLALHLAAVGLIFTFLWQRTHHKLVASALGASWFAFHPALTAAVVFVSVRWNLYSLVLFLACANLYQFTVLKKDSPPSWKLGWILSLCVLPIPFVAEVGVVLAGVLGLWLVCEGLARRDKQFVLKVVLPLLLVPVIYLAFRVNALGGLGEEYHERNASEISTLTMIIKGSLYDLQALALPLKIQAWTSGEHFVRVWVVTAGLLLGTLLFAPIRRAMLRVPFVPIGFVAFAALQFISVWKTARAPIFLFGIERAYVLYFPACLIGIFLAFLYAECSELIPKWGRRLIVFCAVVWLSFSVYHTRSGLSFWVKGGEVLNAHRAQVEPWLREKTDDLPIYARGFPSSFDAPYQPKALVYFYDLDSAFYVWSGKRNVVLWRERHGTIPRDFNGWLLTAAGDTITFSRVTEQSMLEHYIAENKNPSAPPVNLLQSLAKNMESDLAYPVGLEVEETENVFTFKATSPENSVLATESIDPKTYGYLELQYRIPASDDQPTEQPFFQLYWRNAEEGFNEQHSASVSLISDGEWHTIRYQLYPQRSWSEFEEITMLRLDPLTVRGTLQVRMIQLVTGVNNSLKKE